MDRTPALIEAADPPDQDNDTDDAGWADLADRYDNMTGVEFMRLPTPERRRAVRHRRAS